MKQRDIAKLCGVGESTVSGWVKSGDYPVYAQRLMQAEKDKAELQQRIADLENCIRVLRSL